MTRRQKMRDINPDLDKPGIDPIQEYKWRRDLALEEQHRKEVDKRGQNDTRPGACPEGETAGMNKDKLIDWIHEQAQRRSVWAFMERMGSDGGRYHAGYLQALEDVLSFMEGGEQEQ